MSWQALFALSTVKSTNHVHKEFVSDKPACMKINRLENYKLSF